MSFFAFANGMWLAHAGGAFGLLFLPLVLVDSALGFLPDALSFLAGGVAQCIACFVVIHALRLALSVGNDT